MSENTLREACVAPHDGNRPLVGCAPLDHLLHGVVGDRVARDILAALDAEREAGRREALEDVRNALAALECAAGTTSYRMSEPEAFTDGRREGYRLAVEHIHEALAVE